MERTPIQDECVKFYYNMNVLNEEMKKYNEAMKNFANAELKIKESNNYGMKEAAGKWSGARRIFEKQVTNAIEAATEAYKRLTNL